MMWCLGGIGFMGMILDELKEENVDFLGEISLLPGEKAGYSYRLY